MVRDRSVTDRVKDTGRETEREEAGLTPYDTASKGKKSKNLISLTEIYL